MFIKNLYCDEIRDGWLVTEDTKKVWNRSLEIWAEVDRICRKHDIPYWAGYGTLIGAARHKGFVPWDDDIDLMMMRPDFNRFAALLKDELRGTVFEVKKYFLGLLQISHSQTTKIDETYFDGQPQGISLAIFALDIVDDGTPEGFIALNALREVFVAIHDYPRLERHLQSGGKLFNDTDFLKYVSELPDVEDKIKFFWIYAEKFFEQSSAVECLEDIVSGGQPEPFRKPWFDETIYLPFETIELPAPKMFDEILTAYYGDWRTPVHDDENRLGVLHSMDIPWREFLSLVDVKKFLQKNPAEIQLGVRN